MHKILICRDPVLLREELVHLTMFFFFSKALLFLLSPFFWFILSLGLYFFLKSAKWKKRMKWSALFIFVFFTNTVIFSEFCKMWEIPGKPLSEAGYYDVGIVLGGMVEYNSDVQNISIRRQGDRIFQALNLYHRGHVKKLLISGDSGHLTDRGLHEAKQFKDILISWGIPPEDILTEEVSKNTHENARETKKILDNYPEYKSFVIITSGIHMRRSIGCFEKQGMKCASFSTDLYSNQTGKYFWDQYLLPNVHNFVTWQKLFKEMIGYLVYDLKGYI